MPLRNSKNMRRGKNLYFLRQPTSRICIFIILNLLLPSTLTSQIQTSIFGESDCNEMYKNTDCQCISYPTEFIVQCPKPADYSETAKLQIKIGRAPRSYVTIDCSESNVTYYELMPNIKIGYIEKVFIDDCSLPSRTLFLDIFEKLGIKDTTIFSLNSEEFRRNLTRRDFSELRVLRKIYLTSKDLAHLPDDVFMDLKNLSFLRLYAYNIELPKNLFASLEDLTFLELGQNHLRILPNGIFLYQANLKNLNLWGNELRNLQRENFEGLKNLIELDLSTNKIETLNSNTFDLLPNLGDIHLSLNNFSQLPKELFANTKNLRRFRLGLNRVPLIALPEGLFSNLPKLQEIHMALCGLQSLPGNLFANSTNIINISFEKNELAALPEALLSDQSKLRNLELSNNQITEIPDNLFRSNSQLKVLKLSNNQLEYMSSGIFASLTMLEELYLNNNRLSSMDSNSFFISQHLTTVHMQNEFPKTLQILSLRNNSITNICEDWKKTLLELRKLDLSYNKISGLNHTDLEYSSQNSLTVNIAHNQIESINFSNDSLINPRDSSLTLDIRDNPLKCDCKLLRFVQFLNESYRSGNDIIIVSDQKLFCNEPENLRDRAVSSLSGMDLLCPLDYPICPDNCKCWERTFDNTLLVDCSNGEKLEIPNLPDLRHKGLISIELNMTNNSLIKLPSSNEGGYALVTKLMLSNNNLTELNVTRLPRNLACLDIRYNNLKLLDKYVVEFLNESHKFISLQISNNPWICDCDMESFLKFTQTKFSKIIDLRQTKCGSYLEGKHFQDIDIKDICPKDDTFIIFLAVGIALIAILIGIFGALYYKNRKEILIWLYARGIFRFIIGKALEEEKLYDAFISYSSLDEAFVRQYLVPKLEQGTPKFRVCIHSRDWLVGESIANQIAYSVENSRHTIILLSQNFVESDWARMEFRVAHQSTLKTKLPHLIVIVHDDIINKENLDSELKAYIKTNIYLKSDDLLFWEKLRSALLPKFKDVNENKQKNTFDDDHLNPSPGTTPSTTSPAEDFKNPLIAHLNGGTPQTAIMITHCKGGQITPYYLNGKIQNDINCGTIIINPNAKQSDV